MEKCSWVRRVAEVENVELNIPLIHVVFAIPLFWIYSEFIGTQPSPPLSPLSSIISPPAAK